MKFSCPECGKEAEVNTFLGSYTGFRCANCGLHVFEPIRNTLSKYNLIFFGLYIVFLAGMKFFFTDLPHELFLLFSAAVCFIIVLRLIQQKICMDYLRSIYDEKI